MKKRLTIRALAILCIQMVLISSFLVSSFFILLVMRAGLVPPIYLRPLIPLIILSIISFLVSIPPTLVVSSWYLAPIQEIRRGMNQLAKGDYSVKVTEWDGNGEVAELQRSFNSLSKELDSTELFRSDFINTFSHEFKTPIVSIRGFAKQLKKEDLSEDQRQEYIDIIISESERLANMSTNVLLLTKLENVEIVSDQTDFEVDEQIRTAILLLEKKWEEKNLELNIDLDTIRIHANAEMTSHIWNNLIDNAIKFSPKGGLLSVSCHPDADGSHIIVKVSDQGQGMTEEELQHIYDKFYQADASRITVGNGLGLAIVRRVITLCKGTIEVESTLDIGTTFTVTLPVA